MEINQNNFAFSLFQPTRKSAVFGGILPCAHWVRIRSNLGEGVEIFKYLFMLKMVHLIFMLCPLIVL